MRNRIGSIVMTIVLLTAAPGFADVKWIEDANYEDILAQAKEQNKHIFIDFYTVWCSPCKQLDKETYTDKEVVAFLSDMIAVKYDSEKGIGIEVSKRYRVKAWPTMMMVIPDGKEVGRYIGFLNAEGFLTVMGDYERGVGTIADFEEKVKEDPNNPGLWKTLGIKYADAGYVEEATEALNRFFELAPSPTANEKARVLFALGQVNYDAERYERAVEFLKQVVEDYPDTEDFDEATTRLARSYYKTGDTEKCITTYMSYVDRYPEDPKALNKFAWFCASRQVGVDEALPVAIKAVELTQRDPRYLDTLAELYYARREYELAIDIGEEAAMKDPADKYFADQVVKFKKAKADADSRAQK